MGKSTPSPRRRFPTTEEVEQLRSAMKSRGWKAPSIRLVCRKFAEEADDTAWLMFRKLTSFPLPHLRPAPSGPAKQPIPVDLRWKVWERDDFRCVACGSRYRLEVDRVTPESKGGTMVIGNLQTLCHLCNRRKGNRVPMGE